MKYLLRPRPLAPTHWLDRSVAIDVRVSHALADLVFADEWELRILAAKLYDVTGGAAILGDFENGLGSSDF